MTPVTAKDALYHAAVARQLTDALRAQVGYIGYTIGRVDDDVNADLNDAAGPRHSLFGLANEIVKLAEYAALTAAHPAPVSDDDENSGEHQDPDWVTWYASRLRDVRGRLGAALAILDDLDTHAAAISDTGIARHL